MMSRFDNVTVELGSQKGREMKLQGQCQCGRCKATTQGPMESRELRPRICDCDYCQQHPSAIISHPEINTEIAGDAPIYVATNGSGQANFYHCQECHQLLAVGAIFDDVLLGAVNGRMFGDLAQFGEPIAIQPWKLSPQEKAARWPTVWGKLQLPQPSI